MLYLFEYVFLMVSSQSSDITGGFATVERYIEVAAEYHHCVGVGARPFG